MTGQNLDGRNIPWETAVYFEEETVGTTAVVQGGYDGGRLDGDGGYGYSRGGAAAEIKQEGLEFRV